MVASPTFTMLNAIHEKVERLSQAGHHFASDHAYDLAGDLYEHFRNKFFLSDEAKELLFILSQPHVRALFDVHDRVASREYLPVLPDILPQVDEEEVAIKVIKLIKNNEALGVTLKKREHDGVICIARVFVGGPADRSGVIQSGDEVHEVNGIPVKGRSIEQVVHILNTCDGPISLKLVPAPVAREPSGSKMYIRVRCCYDPAADPMIPCKDAGLGFKSGDVLEILKTDDPAWWQARLLNDPCNRTGLIPSRTLQARRVSEMFNSSAARSVTSSPSLNRKFSPATPALSSVTGSLLSPRLHRKLKKNKKTVQQAQIKDDMVECDSFPNEQPSLLYEEVDLYKAPAGKYRPIVLLGAPGVGCHDLRMKILRENPSVYRSPTPCTSRPKKLLEVDGKDYKFVSKGEMEKDIQNQRLIEYGDYKGHLYGIRLDNIFEIICSGKVCILTCHPQALHMLRRSEIKPYIILLKPPSLEMLKHLKIYTGEKASQKLTDHEMEEMVLCSARIEAVYGHYCDEVIINTDFHQTYKRLVAMLESVHTEEMWIPSAWMA